ncbi:MAG: DUF1294 domain-containing protein [Bacteroidales bacterium]|nr:DUF1294 domain-containing protein [Bacteroidales bacterium]
MEKILIIYLVIINIIALALYGIDKLKAKTHHWRIPESVLIGSAIVGGSIGALLGIYLFRHKTQHKKFTIGVPFILILQIAFVIWLILR